MICHPFLPVFDENSRILILGSFPSARSRADGFYYGHPQNRFWRVLAMLSEAPVPQTTEEKTQFLLSHGIALWDVVASCEIENSADSSIRNAVPNDLSRIRETANIRAVFTNGKTADTLYRRYHGTDAVCLPSTSPANAASTLPILLARWRVIVPYLSQPSTIF